MSENDFTQDEIEAFAAKLDDWGGTLPGRERALLHTLLAEADGYARAEEAEAEVAGFGFDLSNTGSLPTLDKLAGSALRPVVEMQNSWKLRAYDRWDPIGPP
jgi:hypothetical protein